MQAQTWQQSALDKYYYGRADWQDGTTQFHELIRQYAPSDADILELGAGPTNKTTAVLASLGTVTGLDIDPAVRENIHCQQAVVYDGVTIPLETDSFDLVVSNYLCEHIEHPLELTREIFRVLRPGGRYIFRTPNLYHYVSVVAKCTPHWFHHRIANRVRGLAEDSHEPYPTYHRMNTRHSCLNMLAEAGLRVEVLRLIECEPSYGMSSRLLFYPFMAWERVLNSTSLLASLRSNILCIARAEKGLPA